MLRSCTRSPLCGILTLPSASVPEAERRAEVCASGRSPWWRRLCVQVACPGRGRCTASAYRIRCRRITDITGSQVASRMAAGMTSAARSCVFLAFLLAVNLDKTSGRNQSQLRVVIAAAYPYSHWLALHKIAEQLRRHGHQVVVNHSLSLIKTALLVPLTTLYITPHVYSCPVSPAHLTFDLRART